MHMRPLQFKLKSRSSHPLIHPSRVTKVMLWALRTSALEGARILQRRTDTRGVLPSQVSHTLGSSSRWLTRGCRCPLGELSFLVTHKLPRDEGSVSSFEILAPSVEGPPCVGLHVQHLSVLLYLLQVHTIHFQAAELCSK